MIIKDESQLRRYLPNAFATVEGEVTLYDKVLPYLAESETWLQTGMTGRAVLINLTDRAETDEVRTEACRAVVCNALMHAIPALDVVLTPNGFGIVSNQNLSPASKERVQRLIDTMEMQRDDAVIHLMKFLHTDPNWRQCEVFPFWSQTLLPEVSVTSELGIFTHQFAEYLALVPRIVAIEAELAESYFSQELMFHLRRYQFGIDRDRLSALDRASRNYLISHIRAEIITVLAGGQIRKRALEDLVNYIRIRPRIFPQWASSATAQLFSPPVFINRKWANGFFF